MSPIMKGSLMTINANSSNIEIFCAAREDGLFITSTEFWTAQRASGLSPYTFYVSLYSETTAVKGTTIQIGDPCPKCGMPLVVAPCGGSSTRCQKCRTINDYDLQDVAAWEATY